MARISQTSEQHLRFQLPDDIFVYHHGAEWHMCTGQSLRECHQIWFADVTVSLPRKPFAAAAKSAHHFIGNQEYAARTCNLAQTWPVIVRRYDAVRARIGLHQNRGNRPCTFAVDFISDGRDRTLAALDFAAATKRTSVCIWRCHLRNAVTLWINLITRTRVSRECHAGVAGAVVGTIARDDPALRDSAGLPREFNRVLIRVGTGHGKKYATILETSLFE